jgi:hypothetical protein
MASVELYPLVTEHVQHLLLAYQDKIKDGLSVKDAAALCGQALKCFVDFAKAMPELSVAEQKTAALAALDRFYVEQIAPLDLPGVPDLAENAIVDPMIGGIVHDLASGLFDVFIAAS